MSHITIIISKSAAADGPGVGADIRYVPDHGVSPEAIGEAVCKLVKKMNKLEQPGD